MGAKKKLVLFVPGRVSQSSALLPWSQERPTCQAQWPGPARVPLLFPDNPGPWETCPEEPLEGGREVAPRAITRQQHQEEDGRQRQVQMPRTMQPKVQEGTGSACIARSLPGNLAGGPCLSLRSRLPPPQSPGPTLPRLHLLPHFPQLQGARGREAQVLLAPWTNPLSQPSPGRLPPQARSEALRLCRVLTKEHLLSSPPPPPIPFPLQRPMQVSRVFPSLPTRVN